MEAAEELSCDKDQISDSDEPDNTTVDTDTDTSSDECSLSTYLDLFSIPSGSSNDTTIKLKKFPIEHYKKGETEVGQRGFWYSESVSIH